LIVPLLSLSVLLQFLAAGMALRLGSVLGRSRAWAWLAAALFLMGLRRGVTLADAIGAGRFGPADLTAEWIALAISSLMVVGLARISPFEKHSEAVRRELARAKADWERTFDAVPDLICILDPEHRILRANRAFAERLGREPKQVAGEKCHDCIHGIDCPPNYCPHTKTLADGRSHAVEVSVSRLGSDFLVTTTPLSGEAGETAGSVHVARDITDLKRVEASLRESERKFRLIAENTSDGLVVFEGGEIVYTSPSYNRIMGYGETEIVGWTAEKILDALHPDDREPIAERIDEAKKNREARLTYRFRVRKPDGSYVWREDHTRLIYDAAGEMTRAYIVARDITEQVRIQEELRDMERRLHQTQKLESLGVLASGIAHDFNNLLMAILGNADLAAMDLAPADPALESVLEIERASRRAAELCRQMLAYSGRGRFVVEIVDIHALIREIADFLNVSISKKALLDLRLADGPAPVRGDATQIRQVVMNLVINASDAMENRTGRIALSSRIRDMSGEELTGDPPMDPLPAGRYVEIEVADTGCGMDPETLDRLFEPFFTTKSSGRGLGMSAVLGIVRGHRGSLGVESEPGIGTTFRVHLPLAEPSEETPDPFPGSGDASGNSPDDSPFRGEGLVLVVDDEPEIRELAGKMLERIGFRVRFAVDGWDALRRYAEAPPVDLVLLDMTMPEMDGVEAFRELVKIDPEVRVVVSSGYSAHEIAPRFPGKNFLGVIEKPYTLNTLEKRLSEAFRRGEDA
jgi:two-component system, cell cycle sensor histidine kinase and response regulator CckA